MGASKQNYSWTGSRYCLRYGWQPKNWGQITVWMLQSMFKLASLSQDKCHSGGLNVIKLHITQVKILIGILLNNTPWFIYFKSSSMVNSPISLTFTKIFKITNFWNNYITVYKTMCENTLSDISDFVLPDFFFFFAYLID